MLRTVVVQGGESHLTKMCLIFNSKISTKSDLTNQNMIPNTSNIELRHQYNVYRLHRFVRLRKSHFLRTRETVNIRRKERSGASVKRRLGIGRDVTSMTLYAPRLERIHCMKSRRLFSRLKRPYVRLVRSTREDHAYGASRLPKTSENDYFAVSQSRSPGA